MVVGASSGIGREVAVLAAHRGARVVVAARRAERLQALADDANEEVLPLTLDLRDPQQCAAVVQQAVYWLGGLDVLVAAAGATSLGGVAETDHATWMELLETNLVGPALVVRAAIPVLEESHGTVVFMSSVTVDQAWPGLVPYAAAKAGLETLCRGLQQEHPGVGFSTIVVGPTRTTVNDHWDRDAAREAFRRWRSMQVLGAHAMEATDVAHLTLEVALGRVRVPFVVAQPDPGRETRANRSQGHDPVGTVEGEAR